MRRSWLLVGAVAATAAALVPSRAQAATPSLRLPTFASCTSLVSYAHANAARTGGGVGVPVRVLAAPPATLERPVSDRAPGAAEDQAAAPVASTPDAGVPSFSTTNVQEAGIDEPDVVKTDGRRIVSIGDGVLRVVDVTGAAPRVVGTLKLADGAYGQQLLLRGDRALVLATVAPPMAIDDMPVTSDVASTRIAAPSPAAPKVVLTEVDLTDPAAPEVARTMTLDGGYVDARMTDGTARIVISSTPVGTPQPLARASLRTFVPATTIRSSISGRTFRRGVVPCRTVRRPVAFSGLDLLTVLTVDLDKGLYDVDRDAIMAGAETVYASGTSLYVASRRYVPGLRDTDDVPARMRTEIHRFDASRPGQTSYAGSGSVPGFVIGQFALSEHDGALRVASTDEPTWLPDGPEVAPSQSHVTVLEPRDGRLVQVGQVSGLGRGERIYAVRFLGTAGYVVTFRQVDPLYTLDLSRPASPRVVGELKIPGYSAYLHPVGDGLLLGIGQEATSAGQIQGTQVSLFDVGDLAHPRRLQQVVYGDGSSQAEFDHHAFLWWAPNELAVLPLTLPPAQGAGDGFTGVIGLRVTRGALAETGRIAHRSAGGVAPIGRSLVVADRLYTLSSLGLQASRLDTLAPTAFVPFS